MCSFVLSGPYAGRDCGGFQSAGSPDLAITSSVVWNFLTSPPFFAANSTLPEAKMPVGGPGPMQLRDLSLRLREMGKEGKGLQRELYRAINDSVKPFEVEISAAEYLKPYMPDRYAAILAGDLSVTAVKRGGQQASV